MTYVPGSTFITQRPHEAGRRQRGVEIRPEAVRQARLEAGLSLAQVAEGEVTRAAIHLVEQGKMRPSMRTLQLIARKTGRPITYFLPGAAGTEDQRVARDQIERLVMQEEFAKAVEFGERLLEDHLPSVLEAEVRFFIGRSHVRTRDGDAALRHLRLARQIFQQIGDQWMATECIDQEAAALFLLEDPRALSVAMEALERCEQMNPVPSGLYARTLLLLGTIYKQRQDWRSAVRFFEKGLDASSSLQSLRHRAMVYDSLSAAYQELGRFATALNYSQRAFALYATDRDLTSLAGAENNLGYLLLKQGQVDAAEQHLNRALDLCDRHDPHKQVRSYVLNSLAELHVVRGDLDSAGTYLHEALQVALENGARQPEATSRQLLGRLHFARGEMEAADAEFTQAIEVLTSLEAHERLRDCLIEYADMLQSRGLLERSIVYWRAAAEVGRQGAASYNESAALLDMTGA